MLKKLRSLFHRASRLTPNPSDRIRFFVVVRKSDKEALTFVSSEEQATEYVNILVRAEVMPHFRSWCELHSLNVDEPTAWLEYCHNVSSVQESFDKYDLCDVYYTMDQLSAILRSVCARTPVGASYEHEFEIAALDDFNSLEESMAAVLKESGLNTPLNELAPVIDFDELAKDKRYGTILNDTVDFFINQLIDYGFIEKLPGGHDAPRSSSKKKPTAKSKRTATPKHDDTGKYDA